MASTELQLTLKYLTDGAHLLRTVTPETSAHLLSQRAGLLSHHGFTPSDVQRQHVCVACGHIMIPGDGTTLEMKSAKRPKMTKNKKRTSGISAGPLKVISCGLCSRATRIRLPAPERQTGKNIHHKIAKTQAGTKIEMVATPESRKNAKSSSISNANSNAVSNANANTSSKKRAKSRKAGLQALLSGQQQRQSTSLSLADFMRR